MGIAMYLFLFWKGLVGRKCFRLVILVMAVQKSVRGWLAGREEFSVWVASLEIQILDSYIS